MQDPPEVIVEMIDLWEKLVAKLDKDNIPSDVLSNEDKFSLKENNVINSVFLFIVSP